MNFLELTNANGNPVLINMNNVVDIHPNKGIGCTVYYVSCLAEEQVEIDIKESFAQVKKRIKENKS